jgi:hypothetical protein
VDTVGSPRVKRFTGIELYATVTMDNAPSESANREQSIPTWSSVDRAINA